MKNQGDATLILCDYGQVLAGFDRDRCAVSFERLLGRPIPRAGAELLEQLLQPFEAGEITPEQFLDAVREPLGLRHVRDEALFQEAWCSILWALVDSIAVIRRRLQVEGVQVHIVTNTDPWRLAYASDKLGMADLFQSCTASFEEGVTPKGADSSMWAVARRRAEAVLGEAGTRVIGIDDLEQNLSPALEDGTLTHGIVFRDASQLETELQGLGL
ncbi:MAG: hypothetical protein ACPG31_11070 [Planctomycetota bacterium]